ncbi:MAG: PLD nuclease N-terminal domain-containing protein [Planctomycetes bacterium]|nr:PLD nuclease N-terminal domain-containing protein [Planctomycetota bacterium]
MQLLPLFADLDPIGFVAGLGAVWLIVGLVMLVAWIWALVDAIRNPHLDDMMRIVWVLVIALTGIIGAIIYALVGRRTHTLSRGGPYSTNPH